MRLRTIGFISTLVLGLLTGPLPAQTQEPGKVPRIGYLFSERFAQEKSLLAAFQQGLKELGYVEGKNIIIEQRYYGERHQRPALFAELVRLKVDVIVTSPGGVRAAKRANSTIPIVMTFSADPVRQGLVASLAHPGGNVTGLSDYHGNLLPKRLELLKEIVPLASRVALLVNPTRSAAQLQLKHIQAIGPSLGVTVLPLEIKGPDDVDRAFAMIRKERPGGLLVSFGLRRYRKRIIDFAIKSRLPAIYHNGSWVPAGGLMSYASSWPDLFRRAAVYVDKILRGAKPAELPVEQPTKFELLINLKTAKKMGLIIPPSILYRADKVIK